MKCVSCTERQQFLLDNGDGSQVVCDHHLINDVGETSSSSSNSTAVEETTSSSTTSVVATSSPIKEENVSRKRKFLTFKDFIDRADEKKKAKIVPITKWATLDEHKPYLVRKVIAINTTVNGAVKLAHYVVLEDEKEMMKNVWITDIIREDLENHALHDENTYIMALGDKISKETGFPYHDFVIIDDKE